MKNKFGKLSSMINWKIMSSIFLVIAILGLSIITNTPVLAATTTVGPNNAGAGSDVTFGNTAWSNPGNITAVGTPYATVSLSPGNNSHYLQGTGYGFGIPAGATINGIQVVVNRMGTQNLGFGIQDYHVYLVKNNVIQTGTEKANTSSNWPTSLATATYGSSGDTWGLAGLTGADIDNANFGVALSAHGGGLISAFTATVDYIQITVTYTVTAPTVTSITPIGGPLGGGTTITIIGTGFVSGAAVKIGGVSATSVVFGSATSITAVTPSGTGAQSVVVTNPDTQSSNTTVNFTYAAAPTVTSIAPTAGPSAGGTTVTITGTGFGSGATVKIGGVSATGVVFGSATSITAVTLSGTGAQSVVVTNPDTQSSNTNINFTYAAAPTVTSIAPTGGPSAGGTTITITGTGFVSGATVKIGGVSATGVVFGSATSITAITPSGTAGAKSVVVTNPDTQSSNATVNFTYAAAPTVTSISPNSGPTSGNTSITITGTGFVNGATVKIGGISATGVVFGSATSITAVTPSGTGVQSVVVTNPDTQSSNTNVTFTFTVSFGITTTGSVTTNLGDPTLESGTGTRSTNYIEAWDKLTTTTPETITSFTIYQNVAGGTGKMHVGLYTDSGNNTPSSLVSGSDSEISLSSATGWITYDITDFNLPAGTYWIVFTFDTANPTGWSRKAATGTQIYKTPWTYGSLPASFPNGSSSTTNGPISMYFSGPQVQGYAKATQVTLSASNANIVSMSFYSYTAGNARLAIYSNSGTAPASIQWQSGDTAISAGWNTVLISSGTPTSLTLSSGAYWLVWQWNSATSGPSYTPGGINTGNYITMSYGVYPASWSNGHATNENWSIYASYTITGSAPTVTTGGATSIADTTVTCGGNITATGGVNATSRGIYYGTTTGYGSNVTESGSFGTGTFTEHLTGLLAGT